jgi:hypothetical protein
MHNEGVKPPAAAHFAAPPARGGVNPAAAAVFALLAMLLAAGGCARPYRGPKTLAAIGASVLVGSAGLWVAGDRMENRTAAGVGLMGALAGAALAGAAGGWLAASTGCHADPDCPEGEACREIPAPPGREPYKQCMAR